MEHKSRTRMLTIYKVYQWIIDNGYKDDYLNKCKNGWVDPIEYVKGVQNDSLQTTTK